MAKRSHKRTCFFRILTSAWLVLTFLIPAMGQVTVPPEVQSRLKKNASELNGLEIRVVSSQKCLVPSNDLPRSLAHFAIAEVSAAQDQHTFRVDSPRFYQKVDSSVMGENERTFDGSLIYIGAPGEAGDESFVVFTNPEMNIKKEAIEHSEAPHFYWEYFQDAGFHAPAENEELGDAMESLPLWLGEIGIVTSCERKGTLFELSLEGPDPWQRSKSMTDAEIESAVAPFDQRSKEIQRKAIKEGLEYSKTQKIRKYRFLLDSEIGFACREKWEENGQGKTISHTVCEQFQQVVGRDLWLPKVCKTSIFCHELSPSHISPKPILEKTNSLVSCEDSSFVDSDFTLWYDKPGGLILDYNADAATPRAPVVSRVPGSLNTYRTSFFKRPFFWVLLLFICAIAIIGMKIKNRK